ncbi:hypothetical protein L226DRAFT_471208 [Lentinus tigrinus ALCF2SS1-7]|uniref:Uncharacterized protein n=1 Tax=Lentinus tigrinus ALCF2SS1-6 TaxID=1328759 RepID=A0A5C2S573_9APHY|nr:hypothetical protein L227DRAFT_504614 [Lentinus tigrinus ALCF2SS1-6]RPD69873.1 hypothetical protein L226DRAFT_471208 [Lentinus tigrinus ALCF2SS1-7]
MTDNLHTSAQATSDTKRRKVEVDVAMSGQTKMDRGKGVVTDKAKANYLSGQLRVRLQYAKLKVEHGWQRQTLNEVENLYFRHTHLTRPYPVISPGGRRNGRTLSVHAFASNPPHQEFMPSSSSAVREQSLSAAATQIFATTSAGAGPSSRTNATLSGSSSSSSIDSASTPSIPSTPNPDASRVATPFAPHVGFGSVTRYPITRSDSTSTVIMESMPSLYNSAGPASRNKLAATPLSSAQSSFREPFDPMEPTEQLDSQLAALRSIITASSMPIPLPPPNSASGPDSPAPSMSSATAAVVSSSGGLTYDAFWSAHSSGTTSYRSLLAVHTARAATPSPSPLQAHGSAPAVLGPSAAANRGTDPQEGAT